ncbi:MAG: hypothetical protein WD070_06690, partial [Pirellulaceae bacterium]
MLLRNEVFDGGSQQAFPGSLPRSFNLLEFVILVDFPGPVRELLPKPKKLLNPFVDRNGKFFRGMNPFQVLKDGKPAGGRFRYHLSDDAGLADAAFGVEQNTLPIQPFPDGLNQSIATKNVFRVDKS